MTLTKHFVGNLIQIVDERNNIGLSDFYGINIEKEFMPTAANTEGLDEKKYKVVRKNRFVFSGMQTGRDNCIRISMYSHDNPIIVSPAYTTFEVIATDVVLPMFFFLMFKSKEKDRLGAFYSDGSIRSNLDWDRFCEIELSLPSIPVQQKYLDIYYSMYANQQCYERGLDDLKLLCDEYIEELRREIGTEAIGNYLIESDQRNTNGLTLDNVRGLSTSKEIIPTKANMDGVELSSYKTFSPGQIAYVSDTSRRGDKVSLGFNNTTNTYLVSSISTVFDTKKEFLLPQYLMLFFSRSEFDRYARFNSWGSARETFDFSEMCDVKIPIPSIDKQKAISDVYSVYKDRVSINQILKKQLNDICPILIKGAMEEAY